MNNKVICMIISLFITSSISIESASHNNQQIVAKKKHLVSTHPKDVVFLWDLHRVVFQRKLSDWVKIFWQFDRKLELFSNISLDMFKAAGNFILHKLRLSKQELTSEEFIEIARNTGNDALIELTLQIGNAYTPIIGTVRIINELKKMGYTHYIGSNIGVTMFERFKKVYPEIFDMFSDHHIVHITKNKKVIKKPNPEYYTRYLERFKLEPHKVIFIDDKKTNIDTARKLGFNVILFINPNQLRNELLKLGFNLETVQNEQARHFYISLHSHSRGWAINSSSID